MCFFSCFAVCPFWNFNSLGLCSLGLPQFPEPRVGLSSKWNWFTITWRLYFYCCCSGWIVPVHVFYTVISTFSTYLCTKWVPGWMEVLHLYFFTWFWFKKFGFILFFLPFWYRFANACNWYMFFTFFCCCCCCCCSPILTKVHNDGNRSSMTSHGRKATIRDFYGAWTFDLQKSTFCFCYFTHKHKVYSFVAAFTNYFSLYLVVENWTLAVILPSLQRLHGSLEKLEISKEGHCSKGGSSYGKKMIEGDGKLINVDFEREDECGICLEPCTKMVLPNCCHAMCIKCYRKW